MTFLQSLKNRLADYIGNNNLGILLKALDQLLVDTSVSKKEAILQESRYNAASKSQQKNFISYEEAQREFSKINAAVLDLIENLAGKDFKFQDQTEINNILDSLEEKTKEKAKKQGNILHRIPDKMQYKEWTECLIRIAYEKNQLYKNLEKEPEDVTMERPLGNQMKVEIIQIEGEENFEISYISSKKQFISWTHPTNWIINIKPIKEGIHKLYLRIGIIEEQNGKEISNEIVVNKKITIVSEKPKEERKKPPLEIYNSGLTFFPFGDQISSEEFNAGSTTHLNNKGLAATLLANKLIIGLITLLTGSAATLGYFDYQNEKQSLQDTSEKIEQYKACQPSEAIRLLDDFIKKEGFWLTREAKKERKKINKKAPWSGLKTEALCTEVKSYLANCANGEYATQAQQFLNDSICIVTPPSPPTSPPSPPPVVQDTPQLNIDYQYQKGKNRLRLKIIDGVPKYIFTIGLYGRNDKSITFDSTGVKYIDLSGFRNYPGEYKFKLIDQKGTIQPGSFIIELDTNGPVITFNTECYEEIRGRAKGSQKMALYFFHSTKSYISNKMKYTTFVDPKIKQTIENYFEYGTMDIANPGNCSVPSFLKEAPAVLLYCPTTDKQRLITGYQEPGQFDSLLIDFRQSCSDLVANKEKTNANTGVMVERFFNTNKDGITYVLLETKDGIYKWVPRSFPEGYSVQVLAVQNEFAMVKTAECLQNTFRDKRIFIDLKDNYYKIFIGDFEKELDAKNFITIDFYQSKEECIKPFLKNKVFVKKFNQ